MPHPNHALLILIGMMGSGKSTVGQLLAKELGVPFVDSDRLIEARSGVSIATIFDVEGEAGFRKREADIIAELMGREGLVVATGGGAVLSEDNCQRMRAHGLVVYLDASLTELLRRLKHDRSRPLLQTDHAAERIAQLLHERTALYRRCAHLTFATNASGPKQLARRIATHPQVIQTFKPRPSLGQT
ncbi:MAG TPA: shikimate kinase [Burkholderiaceae bacterium]|nr:shikimate kinase [Burkholderiaceae bacterium]